MDGNTIATAFFGGIARGKVVQLHFDPEHFQDPRVLREDVRDSDSDLLSTFEQWLRVECSNANMVLFTGFNSESKVASIPMEVK
jgi:hypothetical protein